MQWTCNGANEKQQQSNTTNTINETPLPPDEVDGEVDLQQRQQVAEFFSGGRAVYPYIFTKNQWNGSSSNDGGGKDDFKQQQGYGQDCNFQQNFLGALTWSSAIVCGWYSSQIVCMKRRNAWKTRRCHHDGWGNKSVESRHSFTNRKFDNTCLSRWVLTPPSSTTVQQKSDRTQLWYEHAFETLTNEAEARNRKTPPKENTNFYYVNNNNNNKVNVVSEENFRDNTTLADSSNSNEVSGGS